MDEIPRIIVPTCFIATIKYEHTTVVFYCQEISSKKNISFKKVFFKKKYLFKKKYILIKFL